MPPKLQYQCGRPNIKINPLMEQDQLEFQIHRGNSRAQSKGPPHQKVLGACKELQNQLVKQHLEQAVDDLVSVCRSEYANGVEGQIFPVQIRKNQEEELDHFLVLLEQQLRQRKDQVFPPKSTTRPKQPKDTERVKLLFLQGTQVRDLVLQMYIFLEEHPRHEVVVFISKQITDLSEQNLYCFDKALKAKRFVSVLCTFATFECEVQSIVHTHYQKYHIALYNPKQLFCRFVYQCVADATIKAYLPAGVLTLISDMDFYSISFRQNCRRFVYCLERSLMLSHREFGWVEFEQLIALIEDSIAKKFRLYCGYKNSLQKILKVILSQKEVYTISEKAISLEVAMGAHFTPPIIVDEHNIMDSIRESLCDELASRPAYKAYAGYLLESEAHPPQDPRRKKSRYDLLGIDTKKNFTSKNKLENQLTRIIKQATQPIREQAACIKWEDLKFELRIRPEIPRCVMQSMALGDTAELVKQIGSEYAAPVTKYFSQCESEHYGKLIYLLKTLEICGLVDLNKKHQRPNIYNQYFEKCSFSGKR